MMRRHVLLALEIATPLLLVAAWWVLSAGSTSLYFPSLSSIVASIGSDWLSGRFVSDILPSLQRLLGGYAIGTVLGVAIGSVLGLSPTLRALTRPVLEFMRALPGPALVPVAVVLLGLSDLNRILVIGFTVLWPILLNAEDGVKAVDEQLRTACRVFHVPWGTRFFRVILPAALPQILTGMRVALPISIAILVISELFGTTNGVGFGILKAQAEYDSVVMWSGILLVGLFGVAMNALLLWAQRHLLSWHPDYRSTSPSRTN